MNAQAILRAGFQSGSIMGLADCVTQTLIEARSFTGQATNNDNLQQVNEKRFDRQRTLRWVAAGLTLHGPYFFLGFSKIDRYFGVATSLTTVAKKTAAAQLILFPPYLCLLFSYMGWMEGSEEILEKLRDRVPKAFAGGCVFWPIVNSMNFAFVPATIRVPYLALSAGLWNCYLSWMNEYHDHRRNNTMM